MNKLEAARKIIAKYGLLGPDELEDALRTCPDNTNPMTHLLKLNLINERQESMLKMRLEVELAGEAPAAKQPVEPQQVEGDVAEIEEIPEEELEPIDPSELAPARTERKRPRRRVRPQRRAAAPELVEVPEIIEPEPLPDADELRGKPLGEILVALKLAHNDDIGDAAEEQGRSEGTVSELHIGEILVRKGVVTRRELITALTMQGRALLQCDTCAIVGTNSTEEPISRLDCPNCGGRMLSVESPEVGEDALPVVDLRGDWFALAAGASYKDFTVRKLYSNDGVHSVYIGEQGSLGRRVGIIALDRHLAGDMDCEDLFLASARAAARLTHHTVCAGIDVGEISDIPCYIFEYPDGHPVEEYIARKGPFAAKVAAKIAFQVGLALKYANTHGLVRGQLDPSRVFVGTGVTVKVVGLGFSAFGYDRAKFGHPLGNPAFAAPELFSGKPANGKSEQYCIGALLYYMLSGKPPLRGATWADIASRALLVAPQPLATVATEVDRKLAETVDRLLEKNPASRFDSLDKALNAVAPHAGVVFEVPEELGIEDAEVPRPISGRPVRPRRRR